MSGLILSRNSQTRCAIGLGLLARIAADGRLEISPIYQYECECGERMDDFHNMPGRKWVRCKCGKKAMKIISPCNFILKGAGFFCNDYPKGEKKDGVD